MTLRRTCRQRECQGQSARRARLRRARSPPTARGSLPPAESAVRTPDERRLRRGRASARRTPGAHRRARRGRPGQSDACRDATPIERPTKRPRESGSPPVCGPCQGSFAGFQFLAGCVLRPEGRGSRWSGATVASASRTAVEGDATRASHGTGVKSRGSLACNTVESRLSSGSMSCLEAIHHGCGALSTW
jgi:hypothetical protein